MEEQRFKIDSHRMKYRPEIDGLRAIAVISVIIFHFSKDLLPGGYLGVDVFFVLSGYLITKIIWEEIQRKEFSLGKFYERRIRRLVPALLVVLLITLAISFVILLPTDLVGFSKSLIATQGFVANIFFWRDGGYFSAASETKPLLHMWSLGIEEQFYIFFPFLLILIAKWNRNIVLLTLVSLILGSYILNVYAIHKGFFNPAFFLLPTRAWELGAGAILALYVHKSTIKPHFSLSFLGLLLLILSIGFPKILTYTFFTPNFFAVLGTVLLLLEYPKGNAMVKQLLSLKSVVFLGLISYSLYIWHWPIIVFSKYYLVREMSVLEMVVAFVAIMTLSILSWKYIETPFRKKTTSYKKLLSITGIFVVLMTIASIVIIKQQGYPDRLDKSAAVINESVGAYYRCGISEQYQFGAMKACNITPSETQLAKESDLILLGNSHAQMYTPLVKEILLENEMTGVLVPLNNCLPTVKYNIDSKCIAMANKNLETIKSLPKDKVIIIAMNYWHDTLEDSADQPLSNQDSSALIVAIDDLINQLIQNENRVILIGPFAQPGYDIASQLSRSIAFGHSFSKPVSLSKVEYNKKFLGLNQHFQSMKNIAYIQPDTIQCDSSKCDYVVDGRSLFADSNHLSFHELWRFKSAFSQAFVELNDDE
jgi:peptidoglycan/LPS O-acetylase OafA/YrhL